MPLCRFAAIDMPTPVSAHEDAAIELPVEERLRELVRVVRVVGALLGLRAEVLERDAPRAHGEVEVAHP